jgi:predicted nuclease of predicted toxin-antitoxin system
MGKIRFYFDEHLSRALAESLRRSGYEVILAVDIGMVQKDDDSEHLPFAQEQELVMVTCDRPFAGRTMMIIEHSGLICLSENLRKNISASARALVQFAENYTSEDVKGIVYWLK